METCSGTHFIARQLTALGHDVRLIPAQYVRPFLKGHKNDYRDAEAIAEAVQRPTMRFVAIKTPEQMDLLALHRVRSRLVRLRTGVINQIRGFLIERGITVRQGPAPLTNPDFSYRVQDVKRLRGAARNNGKRCGAQFARVIADAVPARVGRKPGSSYVWRVVLGRQRAAAVSRKWARANSF
jgi:hypothetical protein